MASFKSRYNGSDKLSFKCRACRSFVEEKPQEKENFQFSGYEEIIEWSDLNDGDVLPGVCERIWERSTTVPSVGVNRIAKVAGNFAFSLGDEFWTIYMPALSSMNGWDSYPEEIEKSAFIRCRLTKIYEYDLNSAWVQLEILESFLLSEATRKYSIGDDQGYFEALSTFSAPDILEYEDWMIISSCAQGDIGCRGILKKTNDEYRMILYNFWSFHEDFFYVGNFTISEDRIKKMKDKVEIME